MGNYSDAYASYYRQVRIGSWVIYIVFLLFIAVACGISVSVVNSTMDAYRAIIFFTVLAFIVIIIGSYVLTISL
jgi:hypothetical protein